MNKKSITEKDVKQMVCQVVWQELELGRQGISDWSLLLEGDFNLSRDLGVNDVYNKTRLHEAIEKRLKVHLLCREFEPVQTIDDIVEVVCFKKGIKGQNWF